ncbi:MAG TPA: hypothetical protein VLL54_06875 [Pyrinomonadaceae bacterium]|nr:hypothetical protein [Pyrinomonadaceae bacterium]
MTYEIIQADHHNVLLVDQIGGNFLFRGPNPVEKNDQGDYWFDIEGLKESMRAAVPSVPQDCRLIDINLLQLENANEIPMIKAEKDFFDGTPEAGEFHFWETQGTAVCAMDDVFASDPSLRNWFAVNLDNWMSDPLIYRVEMLNQWLAGMPEPTVIYVHCEGGIDRTGELIGAYYLRWLNYTWAEMNAVNFDVANRPFGCNNYRASLWYCIYLVEALGRQLDYTQAFMCSDPTGPWYACGSPENLPPAE